MYMEEQPMTKQEKKQESNRRYRIAKKEEIKEQRKERMICSCGMEICKRHLTNHLHNSRHTKELQKRQNLLQEKTNINIAKLISEFL